MSVCVLSSNANHTHAPLEFRVNGWHIAANVARRICGSRCLRKSLGTIGLYKKRDSVWNVFWLFWKECSVAPMALVSVFQRLPFLQHLRLRGAPALTILPLLAFLPNLWSLDTEHHVSKSTSLCSEVLPSQALTYITDYTRPVTELRMCSPKIHNIHHVRSLEPLHLSPLSSLTFYVELVSQHG
jgi:hypothetical protein